MPDFNLLMEKRELGSALGVIVLLGCSHRAPRDADRDAEGCAGARRVA